MAVNRHVFANALSLKREAGPAAEEVCQRLAAELTVPASLAFVFLSHHFVENLEEIICRLRTTLGSAASIGCTGESIVGAGREIEGQPALSVWTASLPGVVIEPVHLEYLHTLEGASFLGWPDSFADPWPEGAAMLLLGDPFSFPMDGWLERFNQQHPGIPVIGGMASGAAMPNGNRLILEDRVLDHGAVGARIHGDIAIRTVVSQGCRPIGKPFVITKAERNVIYELGGKPAFVQLEEVFQSLRPADQALIRHGLHVGRVIDEYRDKFRRGDFLIRNVLGVDPNIGAIAVGDFVRTGQTVQFHVRDAATADEDLYSLLSTEPVGGTSGALLFTCNGRGSRLFEAPNHDIDVLRKVIGEIPAAGFFAQGEIGPVGGKNFLHGFTASLALFGARTGSQE